MADKLYLLDCNALIDAERSYYPRDRLPEFWVWLLSRAQAGSVKIGLEQLEKMDAKDDALAHWLTEHRADLLLSEEPRAELLSQVYEVGCAPDLSDIEVERIGDDPFLIAYALHDPEARVVVTTEVSKPKRQKANRHLPDVCADFGVRCIDTFALIRELDFRTAR